MKIWPNQTVWNTISLDKVVTKNVPELLWWRKFQNHRGSQVSLYFLVFQIATQGLEREKETH